VRTSSAWPRQRASWKSARLDDLIALKRAAGRDVDLRDIADLTDR
jgi:hypothetical protein